MARTAKKIDSMNSVSAATSTLFLGHDGEWWDFWLVISVVVLAPIVAAFIGMATAGSIITHKREALAAQAALDRYKLETSGKIADAHTAGVAAGQKAGHAQSDVDATNVELAKQKTLTAQAQLETERIKEKVAWRTLSEPQISILLKRLKSHPGSVNVRCVKGDPESFFFASAILNIFVAAGWKTTIGYKEFSYGLVFDLWSPDDASRDGANLRADFASAGIDLERSNLPPIMSEYAQLSIPGAPTLMVGSKPMSDDLKSAALAVEVKNLRKP